MTNDNEETISFNKSQLLEFLREHLHVNLSMNQGSDSYGSADTISVKVSLMLGDEEISSADDYVSLPSNNSGYY